MTVAANFCTAGKSSLLNTLLREKELPSGINLHHSDLSLQTWCSLPSHSPCSLRTGTSGSSVSSPEVACRSGKPASETQATHRVASLHIFSVSAYGGLYNIRWILLIQLANSQISNIHLMSACSCQNLFRLNSFPSRSKYLFYVAVYIYMYLKLFYYCTWRFFSCLLDAAAILCSMSHIPS